jgi:UPF0755 protein
MKKWRFFLAIVLLSALTLVIGLGYEYFRFTQQPLTIPKDGLVYELRPGTSVIRLANDMAAAGYLKRPHYLRLLAHYQGVTQSLKAGEYELSYGISPPALLDLFSSGKAIEDSLTLIEGWNFRQVLAAITANDSLQHTLIELAPEDIMEKLGHSGEHPEGRFYPDTYHFQAGTPDVTVLEQAYQRLDVILNRQWAERQNDLPLDSPYEALILASIVEKETGKADERQEIAGVFIRRLSNGMMLQTDPTVIYGMGDNFKGNIRRRDLASDTPYNTYVHRGLPPTPICMPGEAAINAVLHPAQGDSLYFVSKGDGSHYFSATLEEHNIAVRRFQLKKK